MYDTHVDTLLALEGPLYQAQILVSFWCGRYEFWHDTPAFILLYLERQSRTSNHPY